MSPKRYLLNDTQTPPCPSQTKPKAASRRRYSDLVLLVLAQLIGVAPVRWASGERFGVEFITLSQRDFRRLQGGDPLLILSVRRLAWVLVRKWFPMESQSAWTVWTVRISLKVYVNGEEEFRIDGAGERNRTSNLRFTKPLLCRLSYASPREVSHTCAGRSTDGTLDEPVNVPIRQRVASARICSPPSSSHEARLAV